MTPSIFARQPLSLRKTVIVLIAALILMWFDSKNSDWFKPVRSTSHAAMQPIYELSLLPSYAKPQFKLCLLAKLALFQLIPAIRQPTPTPSYHPPTY